MRWERRCVMKLEIRRVENTRLTKPICEDCGPYDS
jgi:hypothetical protein